MVYPSKSKTTCLGPRIHDNINLNGLREQLDLLSKATSATSPGPQPCDVYLRGLEREFELMARKIDSLQKERDKLGLHFIYYHENTFPTCFSYDS